MQTMYEGNVHILLAFQRYLNKIPGLAKRLADFLWEMPQKTDLSCMSMTFYSSKSGKNGVLTDLGVALLEGQAPDKGLYMPSFFPQLSSAELKSFAQLEYPAIAFRVLKGYTEGVFSDTDLEKICYNAYNYPVPIEECPSITGKNKRYIMRLDAGPTAAFKDFAARMLARMIGSLNCTMCKTSGERQNLTILVATSGDTGAAVASAFYGVPNISVVVLFPKNEVSNRQRRQMTTLGGNITTLAIEGKFDDCQAMVKRAFADTDLRKKLRLSSANSINVGRVLPQMVYYFYATSRICPDLKPIIFSVPSGNFGDMLGGMFAKKMGLPIAKMIAPVNGNDAFPNYLSTGVYKPISPSRNCLSNAMNVGHPSNLARLVCLYGGRMDETGVLLSAPDVEALRRDVFSVSVSDAETEATLKHVWKDFGIMLEPHGAVGWKGLDAYSETANDIPMCLLETAHPAKFHSIINRVLSVEPDLPESLKKVDSAEEKFITMSNDYAEFRAYLMTRE